MYKFEWNCDHIKSQKDFDEFVSAMKKRDNEYFWIMMNYEQLARLFYDNGNGKCVMVELQVPTIEMLQYMDDDHIELPWLDAYEVENMDDYDASNEICTEIGMGVVLTYDNAETEMLRLAMECCNNEN